MLARAGDGTSGCRPVIFDVELDAGDLRKGIAIVLDQATRGKYEHVVELEILRVTHLVSGRDFEFSLTYYRPPNSIASFIGFASRPKETATYVVVVDSVNGGTRLIGEVVGIKRGRSEVESCERAVEKISVFLDESIRIARTLDGR